jgi:DNA-binding PadR family transcriptional regulator
MPPSPDPASLLPLSEPVFAILLTLADGPRHGYGIITDVERRTSGRLRLGTGTLYTAIHRLLHEDVIEESEPPVQARGEDERRRYYRLTPFGRRVAAAEARRLDALVSMAREQKLLPNPGGGGAGAR